MSQEKPKREFLKKGTRQFLSNATVRSLSQKPKIVQFDQQNFQSANTPFVNSGSVKKVENKEQIVINVKPKNFSKDKTQSNSNSKQNIKKKENSIENKKFSKNAPIQQKIIDSDQRPIQSASLSKNSVKKPTLLSDYLNNDNKSIKKPSQNNLNPVPVPKSNVQNIPIPPVVQTQAHQLQRQNIEEDSDQENQNQENEFTNDFFTRNQNQYFQPQEKPKIQPIKKKPNLLQQAMKVRNQKQNLRIENQKIEQNEVKFDSDSDNENCQKVNKFKSKGNKNTHNNRFKEPQLSQSDKSCEEQNEQIDRKATVKLSSKPQSKVTQMFNKNSKVQQGAFQPDTVEVKVKKMTIDDVPKQLIEEIVYKYFKDAKAKYEKKQQNLFEQVKIVQKKQEALAEQQKIMQKRTKEFEKQLEQRNKEFESKIKSEQNKIVRQKMYLKDQQTGNKLDWKTKNSIQELKQQLQDERNEKKRIQVKLKGELDRLKARFNQQMEVKKNLQNRIKQYELRELKQKQIKVKQERQLKQEMIQKKKSFWDDAPKQSFMERFYEKDFTLCENLMEDYFYERNEFYQYYKQKGDSDTLQVQEVQGNKIKRTYENGKEQTESIQKFIKQVFPWGFTIVHYINGDVKQVIQLPNRNNPHNPKRLEIYYAKNNQIIEYSISDGRRIHYFLADDQIELNDEVIELREIYNEKQLQRIIQGNSVKFQKNAKGNFVQLC